MSRLVFDLSKDGLLCVLRPYQIAIMHCFWHAPEIPRISSQIHMHLQFLGGEAAMSRASVINFLNYMVDEGFLDYEERTGKGGYHRVYSLNAMSKTERVFRNQIRLRFDEKLRTFWKSEDEGQ